METEIFIEITKEQFLYLVAVGFYLFFFGLFLRSLGWKHYAEKNYWRKRLNLDIYNVQALARQRRLEMPFFSILVPARNEADVIAGTIEHLASLNYPHERYEILVITDEKEVLTKGKGVLTTQEVVERKIREFARRESAPQLKHVVVPHDFNGRFRGYCVGHNIPSTKGRALNYGLAYVDQRTQICGFYDAESHPEADVLLYVALRWLEDPRDRIWQGPVFQVRNFYQVGAICKIVALYQALSHAWYLPVLMKRLPFAGGTNLFVGRKLLERIGGYDHCILTEDLELGVRAYLETGVWTEYIPYYSTEQTPATFRAYFRQRLRWGSGHLQVYEKYRHAYYYPTEKREPIVKSLFWKGEGQWLFYQAAVLIPPVLLILGSQGMLDPSILPESWRNALQYLCLFYFLFTFAVYFRFRKLMNPAPLAVKFIGFIQLFTLPLASFFLPLPFSTASIMKLLKRQPQVWVKTPRTKEVTH